MLIIIAGFFLILGYIIVTISLSLHSNNIHEKHILTYIINTLYMYIFFKGK